MFKGSRFSDRYIDLSFLTISLLGIVMIGSASVDSSGAWLPAIINIAKQIVFVTSGFVLMSILRKMFSRRLVGIYLIRTIYIVIMVMMLLCLAFPEVNGAQAWIRIGGLMTLQPSEFAKILCIILLAYYFSEVPNAMKVSNQLSRHIQEELLKRKFAKAVLEPLGLCALLVFVCLFLQNDLGTAVIMLAICAVCFFCADHSYYKLFQKQLWIACLGLGGVVIVAAPIVMRVLKEYQKARITSWLNPLNPNYVLNQSYQLVNGMIAFTNGGLFGMGLGNSTQKFGYIPEAYNDFITAIIYEELGIFGLMLVVVPFTIIIKRLFDYAFKMEDSFSKITLIGIATYFFMHLFLNLGGVSGLIPMTGVPLLCVSAGGSSTWSAFCAIGIAQALIKRYNKSHQN